MNKEKVCTCDVHQSKIPATEAVDIIRQDGRIVARYHKDCEVHGYRRINVDEEQIGGR